MAKESSQHKGHRQRMRARVEQYGLESLEPHEALEYVLYITNTRKDTNGLAHVLMDRFGDFAGVLDASEEDLLTVEGVGPSTARMLHLLPQVGRYYTQCAVNGKKCMKTTDQLVEYLMAQFAGTVQERALLAALDAAATVSSLPVMCTMTVEADGSIFSGGNAVEAAIALEGAGAVAVGINCSVGPDQLVSVVRNIKENVSIPVIAKPNAGMPTIDDQGNAIYSMDAKSFAEHMKVLIENGASVVGGCCGTTPEFIREISRSLGR